VGNIQPLKLEVLPGTDRGQLDAGLKLDARRGQPGAGRKQPGADRRQLDASLVQPGESSKQPVADRERAVSAIKGASSRAAVDEDTVYGEGTRAPGYAADESRQIKGIEKEKIVVVGASKPYSLFPRDKT